MNKPNAFCFPLFIYHAGCMLWLTLLGLLPNAAAQQKSTESFFRDANSFFQNHVVQGRVKYGGLKSDNQITILLQNIAEANWSAMDAATQKAFKINAYNLLVIKAAADAYPIASVQDIAGFFDKKKMTIAGQQMTLNDLEKKELLAEYSDPRLHFVLVCGAVACPPIIAEAYEPERLEAQLNRQTQLALNNPDFVQYENGEAQLSAIFDWYSHDFGGNKKAIFNWINLYRTTAIPLSAKLNYYPYDWSLNEQLTKKPTLGARESTTANNAIRYIVSSTIPKGSTEVKIFNNLYTQRSASNEVLTSRETFYTTLGSALYGLTNRFNVGLLFRYRRVLNDGLPSDALAVFQSGEEGRFRQGLTGIGPQIRWAPKPEWRNFSVQSSFSFPIGEELEGGGGQPYIDWNGAIWNTQFFNDLSIGSSFSLFTELDVLLEDIGKTSKGAANRLSTPATLILSYNPHPKWILYSLGGFSPYWQKEFDYFVQGGFGTKYQFTRKLELELLYTGFRNKFQLDSGGKAATYNLGLRFNL
jgi:Protein of unknown function, DUF547